MLRELAVQNLALIEDVRVELQPGFCAWTGETGAGKSLLLGALGLLLGDRGNTDLLRSGADELRITGRFEVRTDVRQQIENLAGIALEENEVILARRLNRSGRSQAYANDQPVAISTLKLLGSALVDIHGQRESESLLEPAYQLEVLDAYGQLGPLRQTYLKIAHQVRDLRKRYQELSADQQRRQRELSLLRFERDEIDTAELEPNEPTELTQERERLANAQNLQVFAESTYAALYEEEGSVVERLGRLQREAESWVSADADLLEVVARLEALHTEVQDLAGYLRRLSSHWEPDPERLNEIEQRLAFLRRLETKYRKSLAELIEYRAGLDAQELILQRQEDNLSELERELNDLYVRLRRAAEELSNARHKVAKQLASETQQHLTDLGMPDARLEANLKSTPLSSQPLQGEVPTWGMDELELMLAANPGEPARPLRKVASGGELSRTMLALKSVLARHDSLGTLVFDEIDANVGGRLGDILGQKLAALGRTHQVICVTHLPHVASYARHHWTIRKVKRGSRTVTQITRLEEEARVEELASMLRGASRTESTRQEVADMLETGRKSWQ